MYSTSAVGDITEIALKVLPRKNKKKKKEMGDITTDLFSRLGKENRNARFCRCEPNDWRTACTSHDCTSTRRIASRPGRKTKLAKQRRKPKLLTTGQGKQRARLSTQCSSVLGSMGLGSTYCSSFSDPCSARQPAHGPPLSPPNCTAKEAGGSQPRC